MGIVYHCRDEFLQREIAIKMLLPELMADEDTVEVFRQEARLAAQLEHQNIVTIHNIGIENRDGKAHHYIAMEFLPGGSMKGRVGKERPQYEQCLNWMKQLCTGLNYAHRRGVVHQDIKADNVFITHDGNVKIGDFGLALIATGVAIERAVQGKGTPAYMSPELCRGDPQDHRSDIYSLGAVFFELLSGERPYKASGMIEMAMKHATAPIPSVAKLNKDVPPILDKAIQKMMAKSPEDRFQSLADLLLIIEKLLLELQVARLGVSDSNSIASNISERPQSTSDAEYKKQDYAQDWQNYLMTQAQPDGSVAPSNPKLDKANNLSTSNPQLSKVNANLTTSDPQLAKKTTNLGDTLNNLLTELLPDKGALKTTISQDRIPPITIPPVSSDNQNKDVFQAIRPQNLQNISHTDSTATKQLNLLWEYRTAGPIGWASMPVLSKDKKYIYVGSADGVVYSLDALTGNRIWRFQTGGAIISSPVEVDGKIHIASSDGTIYAISAVDGSPTWKVNGSAPFVATPIIHSDLLIAPALDGTIRAIAIKDGAIKWTYKAGDAIVSSPQVLENLVVFGSKDKTIRAISLDKAIHHWTFQSSAPIVSSPLVSTDSVYFGSLDGTFSALEAASGKVMWQYQADKPIITKGTLELATVTICSEDKWVHCLDKYKGTLTWKVRVPGQVLANLVSLNDSLYIAVAEGYLLSFNLRSGNVNWQTNIGKKIEASPLVTNKSLYVGTLDGEIISYAQPN
jgi:serine/threonine protein kinase